MIAHATDIYHFAATPALYVVLGPLSLLTDNIVSYAAQVKLLLTF
jgi:hypothetical protein